MRQRMTIGRRAVLVLALALATLSLWQLEAARGGLDIKTLTAGQTPVTRAAAPGSDGPLVVVAHGFAGSRQMMQGYALPLAQAGYRVWSFDFHGHGRNPQPMRGDVSVIEGTTMRLVDQTLAVVAAAREAEGWTGPVAILGHSMATDIIIRAAAVEPGIGSIVAISAFSQAVTRDFPDDLLLISGQAEARLRAFALDTLWMIDPAAIEGQIVTAETIRRAAIVAPGVEHVGVLFSRTGQRAALDWLDASYDRPSNVTPAATGGWLAVLLTALTVLVWPLSRLLPQQEMPLAALSRGHFVLAVLVPAVLAPGLAVLVGFALGGNLLPVLVADHLAVHLLIYGLLQLAILWRAGLRPGPLSPAAAAFLVVWGLAVFGLALDRYGANFLPTSQRLWIIVALALGAVPFMLADALITGAGQGTWGRRILARFGFLVSLGIAVALNPSELFFLALIAPVILLFYVIYGLMGRWIAQRSGPAAAGLGLGLALAWALGVSFPLFSAAG
ncbi:alpha/beta hydrolase [Seohaeicola saemankumensis]|uniref:alpha/beta hydrolase n=1 Tax=Seohaeicola saemankumensis TaxID=481181 RepID=UPI001E610119|nr:alpha/beta fold hydrolase [Seohaeicola saemankumensis]